MRSGIVRSLCLSVIPLLCCAPLLSLISCPVLAQSNQVDSSLAGGVEENQKRQTVIATKTLKGGVDETGGLHGGVTKSGVSPPLTGLIKMTPAQYAAAVKQYQSDLSQFYLHARDYATASQALKAKIGECTENEQQWQSKLQKTKLTLSQVQIPQIPVTQPPPPPVITPPRVCCARCLITGECGHLGTGGSSGPNPHAAGAARANAMRERDAAMNLAKEQGRLNYAEAENGYTSQKAINEAEVEEKQAQLAGQFGELQQEYGMLKIEKDALVRVKH